MIVLRIRRFLYVLAYRRRKRNVLRILFVLLLLFITFTIFKKGYRNKEEVLLDSAISKEILINSRAGLIKIIDENKRSLKIEIKRNLKLAKKVNGTFYLESETGETIAIKRETSTILSISHEKIIVYFDPFNWYGGGELHNAPWPINHGIIPSPTRPFLTGNIYAQQWGGVIEPYWLSTANVALIARSNQLKVGLHPKKLIFQGKDLKLFFHFGKSLREIHLKMINEYLGKPAKIPDVDLISKPIWSTWAEHKDAIDADVVMNYANEIISKGFPLGLFEIDDKWSNKYGDLEFDKQRFPDPVALIATLHKKGFNVSVWMHPFVNVDSKEYIKTHLIKTKSGDVALTHWWRGMCGLYDFTDPSSRRYFVDVLNNFKSRTGVDAFKFDGGESIFLPQNGIPLNLTSPDDYGFYYLRAISQLGSKTWTRIGVRSQRLSLFTHVMDRESSWSDLRTVIPLVLTFSILGYPFVLPDMVGGNEYNQEVNFELYARWVEVNALLPSIQFSIKPWNVGATEVSLKMLKLREEYNEYLLQVAAESVSTGAPLIRPLWWIDSSDEYSQIIDDEFLVGDKLLVAPVVYEGKTSRDIYLPAGIWKSGINNTSSVWFGPKWLRNYTVRIDELPFFVRQNVSQLSLEVK